jgi:hypothetical protein
MVPVELQTVQHSIPASRSAFESIKLSKQSCFDDTSANERPLGDSGARGYTFRNNNTTIEVPYHVFNRSMKAFIVCNVSAVAALSGLSSNIYFPAQEDIATVRIYHFLA